MSVSTYVNFPGNCREAVSLYARAFRSPDPKIMTFGDAPNDDGGMPEALSKLILNASIDVPGGTLMFSDVPPDRPLTIGNNVSIVIGFTEAGDLRDAFNVLKEGGQVFMELQETFWTKLYGYVSDKYGVCWQLSLNG